MTDQLELGLAALPTLPRWNNLPWQQVREKEKKRSCSECGRPVEVYHRKLSTGMAVKLVRLYHLASASPEKSHFHVGEFDQTGGRGELGVLSLWGLVEEKDNTDGKKRTSGFWRLTDFGRRFVEARSQVPQYALVRFRSEHLGFAGPMVGIRACLEYRNRFNYAELMKTPGQWLLEKRRED